MKTTDFRLTKIIIAAMLLFVTADYSKNLMAATVTGDISNISAIIGSTTAFQVTATGSGTISYKWYKNNQLITGATESILFHYPVQESDNGANFKVVVSDDSSVKDSSAAVLSISSITSLTVLPTPNPALANYHIDANNGDDVTGDGTSVKPFKTILKVLPLLHGGETVLLHNGNYGEFKLDYATGDISTPYTNWVSFMAAPGKTPVFTKVYLHGNWNPAPDLSGSFNMFVRIIGLKITDGVKFSNVNYARIENCIINREGEITGSTEAMSKVGVGIRKCRSINIENCEITHVAVGIGARGRDILIKGNHIHNNSHDGISFSGCEKAVIENNHIHELDDGVNDDVSWGTHVDGIHLYMETDGQPIDPNTFITIRGNRIYHVESMIMMMQNRNDFYNAHDWIIENNVFGGSSGFMIHGKFSCPEFIFRHNSIVKFDGDKYNVRGRDVICNQYDVALPTYPDVPGVQIYNNIFAGLDRDWGWINGANAERFDHNLYYRVNLPVNQGSNPVVSDVDPFVAPAQFDGVLIPNSVAINAGSNLNPIGFDMYNHTRDNQPDIGAYEYITGSIVDNNTPVSDFNLLGNYPNPFNPTTNIKYYLRVPNYTRLSIYNAKGELVKSLVDKLQFAGNYSVGFEGTGFNSGVYFYKLEVNGKSVIRKMIMCK